MILALEAADAVDLGHPGRAAKLRTDYPILQGAQILGRVGAAVGLLRPRLGLQRIHEDLAEAGRDWSHFWGYAGR